MNDLPDEIERLGQGLRSLEQHIEALERRVDTLEHPPTACLPCSSAQPDSALAAPSQEDESAAQAGSLFPVLGKALLGIAGAYVLRAIEETSTLPRLMVA